MYLPIAYQNAPEILRRMACLQCKLPHECVAQRADEIDLHAGTSVLGRIAQTGDPEPIMERVRELCTLTYLSRTSIIIHCNVVGVHTITS